MELNSLTGFISNKVQILATENDFIFALFIIVMESQFPRVRRQLDFAFENIKVSYRSYFLSGGNIDNASFEVRVC